jgi:hypothetical protein
VTQQLGAFSTVVFPIRNTHNGDWLAMTHKYPRLVPSAPARVIGTSRRSLTGRVTRGGESIQFESSLERDFLVLLDFDPVVIGVREQPVRIDYLDPDGRPRHYTPDFLVEYDNGDVVLYEIKYRSNLREEWARLKPKFRAAIRYARANDMRFSILTDQEIRGTGLLANAKFLRPYRDRLRDEAIEEHLVSTLAVLGEVTPEALLVASYWTIENRMMALPWLWRLVATRRIHADLRYPLTMTTPIWVTVGEGFRWQDPHSYRSNPVR